MSWPLGKSEVSVRQSPFWNSMGRKKQQVISHFFAPNPKTTDGSPGGPLSIPGPSSPSPSSRKVSAIVSFSTSKRRLLSGRLNAAAKKQKVSPHRQNPVPSLHQKFINKLIEPCSDIAETSQNQCSKPAKYTPLEQQVAELKNRYPGILLLIEVGYKFRFFGEDAEIASRVLGIFCYVDHNFLTASIPTVRLNVHVRRLVCAGYKVGVVKQTETASIKAHGENKTGPFCRGLSALYTKATLEAAQDMYGRDEGCAGESNYLCCVVEKSVLTQNTNGSDSDVRIGLVAVEISTGEVIYDEFNDDFMRSALDAIILNLAPSELLLGDPLSKTTEKLLLAYAGPASNVRIEHVSRDCFKDGGAVAEVASILENLPEVKAQDDKWKIVEAERQGSYAMLIEGILKMPDLAVQALALIACYLIQFGFERILCLTSSFQPYSSSLEMNLSANTLQQLEILKNNSDGSELGSLMHAINHTLTMYGSRLLRRWVTHPLCDRNAICARLDAVSEITESIGSDRPYGSDGGVDGRNSDATELKPSFYYLLTDVLTNLGRSPDIQRGITRIFHRTATASEFIGVMHAMLHAGRQLQELQIDGANNCETWQAKKTLRSVLLKKLVLASSSPHVISVAAKLSSTLCKEAADKGDLPNLMIISNGRFPEVGEARRAVQLAKEKLDCLIGLYREQLGIQNLEFVNVSGTTHLIELPLHIKAPLSWVQVCGTKKCVRYHPPEVSSSLDHLSLANEELLVVCRDTWDRFLMDFGEHYSEFQAAVQALSALDCLHSLATLAKNKDYVRPIFVDDDEPVQIHISSGHHPVCTFYNIIWDGWAKMEP